MPLETHTSYVCHALSKLFEDIPIYFEMWAENVHTNLCFLFIQLRYSHNLRRLVSKEMWTESRLVQSWLDAIPSDMLECAYKLGWKKVWQNAATVPIKPIKPIHGLQKRWEGTKKTKKNNATRVLELGMPSRSLAPKTPGELFFFVFFVPSQRFCNTWIGFIGFIGTVVL